MGALGPALRGSLLATFCILGCSTEAGDLLVQLRKVAERFLGHGKIEVRAAARNSLAAMVGADTEVTVLAKIAQYKALAGPAKKAASASAAPPQPPLETCLAGVVGLTCVLLVAVDRGMAPWTGKVIEIIAPHGRQ